MMKKLVLLFQLKGKVDRSLYLKVGVLSMALKYALDTLVIHLLTGITWMPLDYLSPMLTVKNQLGRAALVYLALMMIPAAWLGLAMTLKRLRDVAWNPLFSLLFLVPWLNYGFMILLCFIPSRSQSTDLVRDSRMTAVAIAALLAATFGTLGVAILGQGRGSYGVGIFLLLPFIAGCIYGYLLGRNVENPSNRLLYGGAFATFLAANLLILLFAFEGIVCLLMAAPINFTMIFFGALLGADFSQRKTVRSIHMSPLLMLPFLIGWWETQDTDLQLYPVTSRRVIAAPIQNVWDHVVHFSEIPDAPPWLDAFGIAYPLRARIEGSGVGAVRYCEFTTGPFVEPITVWEPPYRLEFSVAQHPPTMEERNPFQHIHPPHLNGYFLSRRGAFQLRAIDSGHTEVQGTTWYTINFHPNWYWTWIADGIVHRIHERVLNHIAHLSEARV